jgi:hypothetical protein
MYPADSEGARLGLLHGLVFDHTAALLTAVASLRVLCMFCWIEATLQCADYTGWMQVSRPLCTPWSRSVPLRDKHHATTVDQKAPASPCH